MVIQKDLGNACLCVPIRFMMVFLALVTFLHGLLCTLIIFNQDARLLPGGYNPTTRWFGCGLGCFGQIFGLTGLLGVLDNKVTWIQTYNYFQWSKLFVGCLIFVADLIALNGCEAYKYDIHSQIAYNLPMDKISGNAPGPGLCEWARTSYELGFVIDFAIQFYMAYVGQCYYTLIQQNPAYLIKFEENYETTIPTAQFGEPANYYIDKKAEAEYAGLRSDVEKRLETEGQGFQAVRAAGSADYGSMDYRGASPDRFG